jgi:transcriptional regulator with XRE-family HTH domain
MRAGNNAVVYLLIDGMKDLDITRSAVAKHLKISQQQLNNMINGGAKVPVKYFHKLADILIIDEETLKQAFIQDYAMSLNAAIQSKE